MADRWVRVGRTGGRFGGIFAAVAMHVIEPLRFCVIRFYVFVTDWPGGRKAAVMANFPEVFFPETEQRGAVEFRIAADVVIGVRMELSAVFVVPHFFGLVLSFEVYRSRVQVVFLPRTVAPGF